MRQITLHRPGLLVAQDVPPPVPKPGEALVRVRRVGVCGTDLHAFAGRQPFFSYPRILGHELGVEILEVSSGNHGLRPGDRCAVEPYLSCGACHACRNGKPNCCEQLRVLGVHIDGGMCGLLAVPVNRLHRSSALSLDQLALVETLGIGAHAVRRSGLKAGEDALVIGAGPIGLAVVQFALEAGGKVRVVDLSAQRRGFAERFGVATLPSAEGQRAEVVFDATGSTAAMQASFQLVEHGGRLVFVGLVQGSITFDDPLFHRREMTLLASRNSCDEFPRIMDLIEQGRIDTTPWVTHRLGLADVPAEFAALREQSGLIKAMIEVGDADE
jgi:2-desacetyl-2-hydroxyethyl bacteriochlorophyllide A dehydrogenase